MEALKEQYRADCHVEPGGGLSNSAVFGVDEGEAKGSSDRS
jgi:hypothetical protein